MRPEYSLVPTTTKYTVGWPGIDRYASEEISWPCGSLGGCSSWPMETSHTVGPAVRNPEVRGDREGTFGGHAEHHPENAHQTATGARAGRPGDEEGLS